MNIFLKLITVIFIILFISFILFNVKINYTIDNVRDSKYMSINDLKKFLYGELKNEEDYMCEYLKKYQSSECEIINYNDLGFIDDLKVKKYIKDGEMTQNYYCKCRASIFDLIFDGRIK